MDAKLIMVIISVFGAIIGVYIFLMKHTGNPKKHVCSDDVVFRDVCDAQRDCIESSVKDLKEYSKERFDRIEELLKKD